jgi:hypothetical protein
MEKSLSLVHQRLFVQWILEHVKFFSLSISHEFHPDERKHDSEDGPQFCLPSILSHLNSGTTQSNPCTQSATSTYKMGVLASCSHLQRQLTSFTQAIYLSNRFPLAFPWSDRSTSIVASLGKSTKIAKPTARLFTLLFLTPRSSVCTQAFVLYHRYPRNGPRKDLFFPP